MSETGDTDPAPAIELSQARCDMVALALTYEGKSAGDPDGKYLDLIAPIESAQERADMAHMDSCALVVRGLWRALGVMHPVLSKPYVTTHAVSDVMQIARDNGALRPREDWHNIEAGDVVIVDGDKSDTHVYTAIAVDESPIPGVLEVSSIDGGQKINGAEGVLLIKRHITGDFVDHRDTAPGGVRAVTAIVDCDKVLAHVAASSEA